MPPHKESPYGICEAVIRYMPLTTRVRSSFKSLPGPVEAFCAILYCNSLRCVMFYGDLTATLPAPAIEALLRHVPFVMDIFLSGLNLRPRFLFVPFGVYLAVVNAAVLAHSVLTHDLINSVLSATRGFGCGEEAADDVLTLVFNRGFSTVFLKTCLSAALLYSDPSGVTDVLQTHSRWHARSAFLSCCLSK